MAAETLTIRLPPEMALLVGNEVARGAYASYSDVIEAALQLLQDRAERLCDIKTSLWKAVADPSPIPPLTGTRAR